jgi:YhcH/YjgK/YiaL family protein
VILDTLPQADRYLALHPRFAAAFQFLRRADLAQLEPGRHVIDGEALFAIVSNGPARPSEEARLECHRRYVDIQFVIAGQDGMGWKPLRDCRRPHSDYDPTRDIRFFDDAADAWVTVGPGAFAIFFPEDAHAPLVGTGTIHKVVIKIAV